MVFVFFVMNQLISCCVWIHVAHCGGVHITKRDPCHFEGIHITTLFNNGSILYSPNCRSNALLNMGYGLGKEYGINYKRKGLSLRNLGRQPKLIPMCGGL